MQNSPVSSSKNADPQSASAITIPIVEIDLGSRKHYGLPISWNDSEVVLLEPSGRIESFQPKHLVRHRILQQNFAPTPPSELKKELLREFGSSYTIKEAKQFLIVARPQVASQWSSRFAELSSAVSSYFALRGFPLRAPDFPLVGIVFPNQRTFLQHAAQEGADLHPRTAGYYSMLTNRLYLYEMMEGDTYSDEMLATIRHEATHQIAFNQGVHQRLSDPPLWVIEGLASIFEAPGLARPHATLSPQDLINPIRFQSWQQMANQPQDRVRMWERMVVDDHIFNEDPDSAYAIAWAVSLYLSQRNSSAYVAYLKHIAQLKPGHQYGAEERISSTKGYTKASPALLIQSVDRFLQNLPD